MRATTLPVPSAGLTALILDKKAAGCRKEDFDRFEILSTLCTRSAQMHHAQPCACRFSLSLKGSN